MENLTCPKSYKIFDNTNKTSKHKWYLAIILGIIFLVLSSPIVYNLTNKIFTNIGMQTVNENGVPSLFGIVLHAIVFLLISRIFL